MYEDYKDLDLPFNVDDLVFCLHKGKIFEMRIERVFVDPIDFNETTFQPYRCNKVPITWFKKDRVGKDIFATRTEAEARLKELNKLRG